MAGCMSIIWEYQDLKPAKVRTHENFGLKMVYKTLRFVYGLCPSSNILKSVRDVISELLDCL